MNDRSRRRAWHEPTRVDARGGGRCRGRPAGFEWWRSNTIPGVWRGCRRCSSCGARDATLRRSISDLACRLLRRSRTRGARDRRASLVAARRGTPWSSFTPARGETVYAVDDLRCARVRTLADRGGEKDGHWRRVRPRPPLAATCSASGFEETVAGSSPPGAIIQHTPAAGGGGGHTPLPDAVLRGAARSHRSRLTILAIIPRPRQRMPWKDGRREWLARSTHGRAGDARPGRFSPLP